MELEKRLNKQVKLQAWMLGLAFITIIGFIVTVVGIDDSFVWINGKRVQKNSSISLLIFVGIAIIFISWIAHFVLWILGIINAVNINKITNDSTLLIVFSVIPLWIAAIIIAVIERNKYRNQGYLVLNNNFMQNNANVHDEFTEKQQNLQNALANGVITAVEFEEKMKTIKDQYRK